MLVTLDEAKLYMKVDGDTDDSLITSCINSAEELCEDILRFPLAEFAEIPETVKQAALYAIGNLYEQRETVDMQSMIDLMKRLLFAYRKEGW